MDIKFKVSELILILEMSIFYLVFDSTVYQLHINWRCHVQWHNKEKVHFIQIPLSNHISCKYLLWSDKFIIGISGYKNNSYDK